jgi:hypothetical protein
VTRDGDRFFVQRTGEMKDEMFPEGEHDYFAKLFDDQISFHPQTKGKARETIYHENGTTFHAKRIE